MDWTWAIYVGSAVFSAILIFAVGCCAFSWCLASKAADEERAGEGNEPDAA